MTLDPSLSDPALSDLTLNLSIGAKAIVSLLEGEGDEDQRICLGGLDALPGHEDLASECQEEWLKVFQGFDLAAKR